MRDDFMLGHKRADTDFAIADQNFRQARHVLKVDQVRHLGHAQLHHRDKTVATRHDPRIVAMFL